MSEAQGQGQAAPEAQDSQAQADGQQAQNQQQAPEGYLDQKTVNKIVGQRAQEAEQKARADIAEMFGYEDPAELDSVAEALKAWEEENETEADKQAKRAEKLEARAKTAEARYSETLKSYALRDALRDAGINPERLKGAMRLADTSSLGIDKEGNVEGIEDVVEAVREEAPEFFGGFASERPRVNAPQTNGTGIATPSNSDDIEGQYSKSLLGILQGN